jgi:hypothetical protein
MEVQETTSWQNKVQGAEKKGELFRPQIEKDLHGALPWSKSAS